MANWLRRATSLFQQPPPPEPFEVECDCGAKVVGQRSKSYQRPSCLVCERPVFVLPANIYPHQKPKSPGNPKSIKNRGSTAKPAHVNSPQSKDNTASPTAVPTKGSTTAISGLLKETNKPAATAQFAEQEPAKAILTPLRLIMMAVIAMTAIMFAGLWHRNRVERAKSEVSQAADAGMAALRANDFPKAADELGRARAAVDLLGRTDQAANEIRRFSREAAVLSKLASSSLTDFLLEKFSTMKPDDADLLKGSSLYKDAWIIFDANLIPAVAGGRRLIVDAPLSFTEADLRIEIDSPILQQLLHGEDLNEGSRCIFAAQLEHLSPPSGEPPTAVLALNGKSVFLWTNYETFAAAGYHALDAESEQQTRILLDRQLDASQKK